MKNPLREQPYQLPPTEDSFILRYNLHNYVSFSSPVFLISHLYKELSILLT